MKKVLIVDDDFVTRCVLRDILETAGYRVSEAQTGEDALEIFGNFLFDFIFIDIVLPGKNGLALVKEMLSMDRNAKIVLISVLDDMKLVRAGFTLGVLDFLHKPFNAERVLLALQQSV